ncbi:MAG: CoA transferase [Dehalococcoidia bacterium]|jgi:crotonobetainyl-CoA:carnitine CoA-transferase CaiB-like acyl-CoA transferase
MNDAHPDRASRSPLAGVRVLEFSQIVAGPVAGLNLADLGADVIKVEPPAGDSHRFVGTTVPGESKMFQGNNRGKRSLVVDVASEDGRALIHRLIPSVDVVISNFRLGVPERLGIDYRTLRRIRPDLIYVQITGFGEAGPGATWAGSDLVAQAHSGIMALEGKTSPSGVPQRLEIPISDYAAGLAAAMAVCAALLLRERTGEGQYISTSLLRAALHMQNRVVMREPVSDVTLRDPRIAALQSAREEGASFQELVRIREGRGGALASPFALYYRVYHTSDGAIALGALTPQNRDAIRRVLGIQGQEFSDTPDFDAADPVCIEATNRWREQLESVFAGRRVDEWLSLFLEAGVPCARLNFPEEMTDDQQANADGVFLELEHSVTGPQKVVGPIVTMSNAATGSALPAPALGEHTREILLSAGFTAAEIDALSARGVVRTD